MGSSLGCILKYECFDLANLKKERLTHYYNEVWPQYQLGTKICYENGTLDYDTILHLDQYYKRLKRWSEIPYMQSFMSLYQNPTLCKGHARPQRKLKESNIDILDDPLLQEASHVS
jgi:hypothetical protein